MMQMLRYRLGLRWQKSRPPVARPLWAVFIVMLLLALASTIDYHVQKAAEVEPLKAERDAYLNTVLNCMNAGSTGGISTFYFPDSKEGFECRAIPLGRL
jgi:hypothetical protein